MTLVLDPRDLCPAAPKHRFRWADFPAEQVYAQFKTHLAELCCEIADARVLVEGCLCPACRALWDDGGFGHSQKAEAGRRQVSACDDCSEKLFAGLNQQFGVCFVLDYRCHCGHPETRSAVLEEHRVKFTSGVTAQALADRLCFRRPPRYTPRFAGTFVDAKTNTALY